MMDSLVDHLEKIEEEVSRFQFMQAVRSRSLELKRVC